MKLKKIKLSKDNTDDEKGGYGHEMPETARHPDGKMSNPGNDLPKKGTDISVRHPTDSTYRG